MFNYRHSSSTPFDENFSANLYNIANLLKQNLVVFGKQIKQRISWIL